ncbi:maleylpyruvate isomerase family mycothiol-dependent enzyme [Kitasatospora sp. MAP5-34]|uniref:maleylpyruvate isomerase family mycothiol-dependent enzyme n=1 Tax=Kitasatospora sp. MAP5-34 TaxID=3035102 RepID=UPI00247335CA|nr:maleylpyruvate isomerase family mycothiol-dependent enzyme [Kitasatospora sp. MAP5-34]MDH6578246.1 maleylpyruvate isomerase [Kitasatospora sp. MAP5-34]
MSDTESVTETAARTLREVAEATERLLRTVEKLPPEAVAEPSALPGWTRGHVLAHVARNADSLVNLLESARTGREIPQYRSLEARDQDIEDGSGRPLAEQLADLRGSNARFAEAAELSEPAWYAEVRHRAGYLFPAHEIPWRRLMEVEYHHVDLAAGYTPADWPFDFAAAEFRKLAERFSGLDTLPRTLLVADDLGPRLHIGAADAGHGLTVEGPVRALTAWLSGRSDGAGLQVQRGGEQLTDARSALPKLPAMG